MFSLYLDCVVLPDNLKAKHNIKITRSTPRLDCVRINGFWKGIDPFINSKGMLKFDLIETKGIINAPDQRRGGYYLQSNSLNFSTVYEFLTPEYTGFGFGNPNGKKTIRAKGENKSNPMLPFKDAGYLFIYAKDYSRVEILVIENGFYLLQGYVKQLASGEFDEALNQMRATAQTFYEY